MSAYDVVLDGWKHLVHIVENRAAMWQTIAETRSARIAYLEARCAKLEQALAQKGKV